MFICLSKVTDRSIIRQLIYILCLSYGEYKENHNGWKARNQQGISWNAKDIGRTNGQL